MTRPSPANLVRFRAVGERGSLHTEVSSTLIRICIVRRCGRLNTHFFATARIRGLKIVYRLGSPADFSYKIRSYEFNRPK